MCQIKNHSIYNFNSIISFKILLKSLFDFPRINKLVFFFIINSKQYKKNVVLFYIIISLMFGGLIIFKKKIINKVYVISLVLKKKKILKFLLSFINMYLPMISVPENVIKLSVLSSFYKNKKNILYRLNYFNFPSIYELEVIYTQYEFITDFINNYKLQLDFFIKTNLVLKNSIEFLPRMYRFPCLFKINK